MPGLPGLPGLPALAAGWLLRAMDAGATGLAAVQIGAWLGANVIASASSQAKRALASDGGAAKLVDSRSETWRDDVRAANDGKAIDVVFDPIGGDATERAFRTLAWKGRHLVVGFPAGIPSLPTNLALLKGASLVGVNHGAVGVHEPELARTNHTKILELDEHRGTREIRERG